MAESALTPNRALELSGRGGSGLSAQLNAMGGLRSRGDRRGPQLNASTLGCTLSTGWVEG